MTQLSGTLRLTACLVQALLALALYVPGAAAQVCEEYTTRELFEQSAHVNVVLVTDARFFPAPPEQGPGGRVLTHFEVLETLRGDPDAIPYIESAVDGRAGDSDILSLPVGRRVVLFATEPGPYFWDRCTFFYSRVYDCRIYELRKLAGVHGPEDRRCADGLLREAFRQRGVVPAAAAGDLEGLRREWRERFGEDPP